MAEPRSEYDQVVLDLVSLYQKKRTIFLSEGDSVLHLNTLLHNIPDFSLEVHSELRPWIQDSDEILRGQGWENLEGAQVNWAAKVDLAVTDPGYFKAAYEKIREIQGKKKELKYWRILLYPLKAFHAIFEIKVKVHRNKSRIVKDLNKLTSLYRKNENCQYYLIVLDRAATIKRLQSIEQEASKHPHVKYVLANDCEPLTNIKILI